MFTLWSSSYNLRGNHILALPDPKTMTYMYVHVCMYDRYNKGTALVNYTVSHIGIVSE